MMKYYKAFFALVAVTILLLGLRPATVTHVHLVAMARSDLVKALVNVNGTTVKLKQGQYAEFDVEGDVVETRLDVKLPLGTAEQNPPVVKGGGDLYLVLAMKEARPFRKTVYAVDTICRSCYETLLKKAKRKVKLE